MAIVSVKIGPGQYKFSCANGQEDHMKQLAEDLNNRAEKLLSTLGFMPENQLLAMICILLAEEKNRLAQETNAEILEQSQEQITESLQNLALKIETLAETLQS